MKVLHLSLNDRVGGACIAAYRQHLGLLRAGVDSQMLVRFKTTDDPHVHEYSPSTKILQRAPRLLRRHRIRSKSRRLLRSGKVFLDDRSEYDGHELAALPEADVINVQSFWNFLHIPALFDHLPDDVPVVITMHEMAPFTGGCDYAGDCRQFEADCAQCPMMHSGSGQGIVHQSWKRKHDVYRTTRRGGLHFVADSTWLGEEAGKSSLLKDLPLSVIHYGVDTDVFRPLGRDLARDVLQIPHDQPVVCFAATYPNDTRKGLAHLTSALRMLRKPPFVLTWGVTLPSGLEGMPSRHLGPISSEYLMALAYSAADVFVMPSLQEAFGLTALEAISCGVPVAAFATGGIPDTVLHERTGLLAPVGDTTGLASAMERILSDREMGRRLGDGGRRHALDHFSMQRNAENYIALYRRLLGRGAG